MSSGPVPRLQLPRSRRIKQGRDFARARARGQRLSNGCLILNWLPLAVGQATRVGVITSRKVGNAVRRNQARRWLREAFRLHQHRLAQPLDVVIVARPSITGKKYAGVERDYLAALRRAGLLKSNEPGANAHLV